MWNGIIHFIVRRTRGYNELPAGVDVQMVSFVGVIALFVIPLLINIKEMKDVSVDLRTI